LSFNKLTGALPAAPLSVPGNEAFICPNPLSTIPGANDVGWEHITGTYPWPWWETPSTTNNCDEIFRNGLQ
jgi:hypothetical protein